LFSIIYLLNNRKINKVQFCIAFGKAELRWDGENDNQVPKSELGTGPKKAKRAGISHPLPASFFTSLNQ
jgi:hypothetical protein